MPKAGLEPATFRNEELSWHTPPSHPAPRGGGGRQPFCRGRASCGASAVLWMGGGGRQGGGGHLSGRVRGPRPRARARACTCVFMRHLFHCRLFTCGASFVNVSRSGYEIAAFCVARERAPPPPPPPPPPSPGLHCGATLLGLPEGSYMPPKARTRRSSPRSPLLRHSKLTSTAAHLDRQPATATYGNLLPAGARRCERLPCLGGPLDGLVRGPLSAARCSVVHVRILHIYVQCRLFTCARVLSTCPKAVTKSPPFVSHAKRAAPASAPPRRPRLASALLQGTSRFSAAFYNGWILTHCVLLGGDL
ncbi:Protein of unknown function [Gryllus bimaculatus]|nr:Protein of unknown function [Gryllus bimaculatus]